ncbi:MAG: hypothetical protein LBH32_13205 [Dysgonamonadaceae bacterium]|jgi:hypothetical protein|nr:hypothetical protein [Dysgonamonadaceae bacterium]
MKKIVFILITFVAMVSCSIEDSQLDRTIFIPDENDNNLPAYTESGYNVFGAKYERKYFTADKSIVPCKIMYSNGSVRFLLSGVTANSYPQQTMSLTFIFPSEQISDYSGLLLLDKVKVDLSQCVVKMNINGMEKTLNIVKGNLNFKRVQKLCIDDLPNRIILSGTFELQFLTTSEFPEKISDGRFDVGITDMDFYIN